MSLFFFLFNHIVFYSRCLSLFISLSLSFWPFLSYLFLFFYLIFNSSFLFVIVILVFSVLAFVVMVSDLKRSELHEWCSEEFFSLFVVIV